MIDIKLLREHADLVRANMIRRKCPTNFDSLIEIDNACRTLQTEVENLRAERNRLSRECRTNPEVRETVRRLKDELGNKEAVLARQQTKLQLMLDFLPNLLADDVPDGLDDTDNVEIRRVGEIPQFDFKVRDHQELGDLLDILDTQRGAKVAGAGFYYWKGKGAQLAQAIWIWR